MIYFDSKVIIIIDILTLITSSNYDLNCKSHELHRIFDLVYRKICEELMGIIQDFQT